METSRHLHSTHSTESLKHLILTCLVSLKNGLLVTVKNVVGHWASRILGQTRLCRLWVIALRASGKRIIFFPITMHNTHKSDSQKQLYEIFHPNIEPNSSACFANFKSFFHEIHGRIRYLIPAYSETRFDRIGSRPI